MSTAHGEASGVSATQTSQPQRTPQQPVVPEFTWHRSVDRRCFGVCACQLLAAVLLLLWLGLWNGKALMCVGWSVGALCAYLMSRLWHIARPGTAIAARLCLVFFMATSVIPFHYATMEVRHAMHSHRTDCLQKAIYIERREMWDHALLDMDHFMLGKIFPEGQLSLHVDKILRSNPNIKVVNAISELMLVGYHTHFVWGTLFILWMSCDYFVPWKLADVLLRRPLARWNHRRYPRRPFLAPSHHRFRTSWARVQMVLIGWVTIAMLSYLLNFIFVASGPGVYLMRRYKPPVVGLGRWGIRLKEFFDTYKGYSFGSFPSSRVGLCLYVTFACSRFGYETVAWLFTYGCFFVTFGALYLRAHYLIDILATCAIVFIGMWVAMMQPSSVASLNKSRTTEDALIENNSTRNTQE